MKIVFFTVVLLGAAFSQEFKNFFGVCWRGNPCDNAKFAQSMGYDYIMYKGYPSPRMEDCEEAKGMKFVLESPEYSVYPISRALELGKDYTDEQIALYEKYFAWKSDDTFPDNLATGWFWTSMRHSVEPDFMQQEVIDYFVSAVIEYAKAIETDDFKFGGFAWDVPDISGDFWKDSRRVGLSAWRGNDTSFLHSGITHEYETYSDGRAKYLTTLKKEAEKEFGECKYLLEPSAIYGDWISKIMDRDDKSELLGDFLMQECNCLRKGNNFYDDNRIFNKSYTNGLQIDRNMVSCTTPDEFSIESNFLISARASSVGSWNGWFGRFGGTGDMPAYENINEIPSRLQLSRAIPGWENLNEISIDERDYDEEKREYKSPNTYNSENIMYSRHPVNSNLYIVILNLTAGVDVKSLETERYTLEVGEIYQADGFFLPGNTSHKSDFIIENDIYYLEDENNLGVGYIFELTEVPIAIDDDADDETGLSVKESVFFSLVLVLLVVLLF